MAKFERRLKLSVSAADAFAWHARAGALQRLSPPWERVAVRRTDGSIENGSRTELAVALGPLSLPWIAEHSGYCPPDRFIDEQVRGPFRSWVHTHSFADDADGGSVLTDQIDYMLPMGGLGAMFGGAMVRHKLQRMFAWRHVTTAADMRDHQRFADQPRQRVVITGASGLIGTQLSSFLTTGGHTVTKLVRREPAAGSDEVQWQPSEEQVMDEPSLRALEGVDVVVHLAGKNVDVRWTEANKREILASRVDGTRRLTQALASLDKPPRLFICASAIGFYGDSGQDPVTEQASRGGGFLAEVADRWEQAAQPAIDAGIRVVNLRIGVVLSARSGALAELLLPTMCGVAGRIGSGRQPFAWVSIDDVIGAIGHFMFNDDVSGPVNIVAPATDSNASFMSTLGRVVRRPTVIPLPAFVIKLLFGQMGQEALLYGQRAVPERLQASGYKFRFTVLEDLLRHELGRSEL